MRTTVRSDVNEKAFPGYVNRARPTYRPRTIPLNAITQYAGYIVRSILTVVALGLLALARHLHREQTRTAQRGANEAFRDKTSPAGSPPGDDAVAIHTLLAQAIAGTRQAARAVNETQTRLEALSARLARPQAQQAAAATQGAVTVSDRPSHVAK